MRTENPLQEVNGSFLRTAWAEGRDFLINGINKYLNFNAISGAAGYGLRDNNGTIEVKNSGGSWSPIPSSAGSAHIIEDEGTPLTQRSKLNFVGAGVSVTDDSIDDATVVTINSTGGGITEELAIAYAVSL